MMNKRKKKEKKNNQNIKKYGLLQPPPPEIQCLPPLMRDRLSLVARQVDREAFLISIIFQSLAIIWFIPETAFFRNNGAELVFPLATLLKDRSELLEDIIR